VTKFSKLLDYSDVISSKDLIFRLTSQLSFRSTINVTPSRRIIAVLKEVVRGNSASSALKKERENLRNLHKFKLFSQRYQDTKASARIDIPGEQIRNACSVHSVSEFWHFPRFLLGERAGRWRAISARLAAVILADESCGDKNTRSAARNVC